MCTKSDIPQGEHYYSGVARRDIKAKIWGHLGFVLQWAINGLKR